MNSRPVRVAFAMLLVTLPFVQVGTFRAGMRFIPPDVLAIGLLAFAALRAGEIVERLTRAPAVAAAAGAALLLCSGSIVASVISVQLITSDNFLGWSKYSETLRWLGPPSARTTVENLRLIQCVAAFLITLVMVTTMMRLRCAAKWYVVGATLAAAYGLYVWVLMVTGASLPVLPGTFSYMHLKRTAATFPEPSAFAGYALTGIGLTMWLVEQRDRAGWLVPALVVQLFAACTTFSTLLLAGLALVWLIAIRGVRPRLFAGVTACVLAAAALAMVAMPTETVLRAIRKPFTAQASWLDRSTAWRTAANMAADYPLLGVGAGLYAYNQAPFYPADADERYAGGRVNSVFLEIAAENGVFGLGALLIIFGLACYGSARGRHGPAGLRGAAILLVLGAGYYSSRYAFLWVFTALLIASDVAERDPLESGGQAACGS